MSGHEPGLPLKSERLKEVYGTELELIAEGGQAEIFVIKAEFQLGSAVYAALQSARMKQDDEVELFRVIEENGEPKLETIEDDEEWELASEGYDELLFADHERP
ncbi:DUF1292 domain-containing protein [Paenibacillus sp. GCM10023252]|uniref:DUF1292 domain-containing protein n=1 Tax=Paenibacillus sp. GCM10023252 TaxID=3252649 RepID=UPI003608B596